MCWPATGWRKISSRWRKPMPGTSLATLCRSLETAAPTVLGEVLGRDGVRYDIQLKGSGRTAFSRRWRVAGQRLARCCASTS